MVNALFFIYSWFIFVPLMLLATVVAGHAMKHLLNSAFFILLPELKTSLGLTKDRKSVV